MLSLAILRHFSSTSLLFDQISLVTLICFFLKTLWGLWKRQRSLMANFRRGAICAIISVFFLSFTLLNIDRSRSVYVLSWISKEQIIVENNRYLVLMSRIEAQDSYAIKQRIEENIQRKLVSADKEIGTVKLTRGGDLLLSISECLANIFNLQGWKMNS